MPAGRIGLVQGPVGLAVYWWLVIAEALAQKLQAEPQLGFLPLVGDQVRELEGELGWWFGLVVELVILIVIPCLTDVVSAGTNS